MDDVSKEEGANALGDALLRRAARVRINAGGVSADSEEIVSSSHAACHCCKLPITDDTHPEICTPCRTGVLRAPDDYPVGFTVKNTLHRSTECRLLTRGQRRYLKAENRRRQRRGARRG